MKIYADNAATTKMSKQAIDAMIPYMEEIYGNPSSLYEIGQKAKEALEEARERVAKVLNCQPREIIFTSGGSEADNQAINSAAKVGAMKGKKHIISTTFEHHAVLHTLKKLEKEGFEITLLDVHSNGLVDLKELEEAIRPDTALVTIMYANNEIGTYAKDFIELSKKHSAMIKAAQKSDELLLPMAGESYEETED